MKRTVNTEDFTKQLDNISSKVEKLQSSVSENDAKIRLLDQQAKMVRWLGATLFGAVIAAVVAILIK